MKHMKAPFILMVDRGDCTFVHKVRNAQRAGAAAVIIADTLCLCDASSECTPDFDNDAGCESKEPIMADDGSGADITIPSFLMFKQDADPIKNALKENTMVRMEMSWALPRPDDRVEYELWTTPKDLVSRPLQRGFRQVAEALGDHAFFTPHMYVYDGVDAGCQGLDGENQCYNLCTNNGKYCSTDPDDDLDSGLSGADIVTESLRRMCIWREYGTDGIGLAWWGYVDEFLFRCDQEDFFTNEQCIKDAMKHAGVDWYTIQSCMDDSGGLKDNSVNTLLEEELAARESAGVVILPSLYVNSAPLRGKMIVAEVFEAICAGFAPGSEPDVCKKCRTCVDIGTCINKGHCPGEGNLDTVSTPVFLGTLSAVVLCFSCIGLVQWQRSQRQMRAQVRGILAEYMPIDESNKVDQVGFTEPDGETDSNLS
jgi:hypothetical protein